jgi:hypothetical protein
MNRKTQKVLTFGIALILFFTIAISIGKGGHSEELTMTQEVKIFFSSYDIDPFFFEPSNRHGYSGKALIFGTGMSDVIYRVNFSIWFWNENHTSYLNSKGSTTGDFRPWNGPLRYCKFSDASYDLVENKISTWELRIFVNNELIGYDNCFYGYGEI